MTSKRRSESIMLSLVIKAGIGFVMQLREEWGGGGGGEGKRDTFKVHRVRAFEILKKKHPSHV